MNFARRVFLIAGVYGILVLTPQYFLEDRVGVDNPPPVNHPEFYYGFTGVALAWQVLFLIIARDPVRLRPAMLPGVLEKFSFTGAGVVLYLQGRAPALVLGFSLLDGLLGVLFLVAWKLTPSRRDEG